MYEGNSVDLQMEKMLSAQGIFDDESHRCQVYKYDMEEDYIYLLLKEDDLRKISLDAEYECYIATRSELLSCLGTVIERYQCEKGNILKFKIKDGFYTVEGVNPSVKRK